MAYLSSTSTAPNTPMLVIQGLTYASSNVTQVAGLKYGTPRIWTYASTHASSEISSVNFFGKDVQRLGFVVGDLLLYQTSSQSNFTTCLNAGATTSLFSTAYLLAGSSS